MMGEDGRFFVLDLVRELTGLSESDKLFGLTAGLPTDVSKLSTIRLSESLEDSLSGTYSLPVITCRQTVF